VENTPNGFPRLAAFQSSDTNFSLYRSFSYLHSRVLLDLQDEITSLEKLLDEVDEDDEIDDPDRLRSREIDVDRAVHDDDTRNRRVILHQIRVKLLEYGMFQIILYRSRHLKTTQMKSLSKQDSSNPSKGLRTATIAASDATTTTPTR
jgi:hypothetical protein